MDPPSPAGLRLARVVTAHGIQGRLRVESGVESLRPYFAGDLSVVDAHGVPRGKVRVERLVREGWSVPGSMRLVIGLAGVRTRRQANGFRGCWLVCDSSDPQGDGGRALAEALAGCDVYAADRTLRGRVVRARADEATVSCEVDAQPQSPGEPAAAGSALSARLEWIESAFRTIDLRTRRIVVEGGGFRS